MVHKILEQLEDNILAQASKNLASVEKSNKPLIDPSVIFAYDKMIEKLLNRGNAQAQTQIESLDVAEKINLGKDQ